MLEVAKMIEDNESLELISESISVYFLNAINETNVFYFDNRPQKVTTMDSKHH